MGELMCYIDTPFADLYISLQVPHLGLDAAREAAKKKVQEITFEPANTELMEPKEGKHDNEEHSGGNTYAGGVNMLVI